MEKVAVIKGGRSSEREISLKTAKQVSSALKRKGYKVITMEMDKTLPEMLKKQNPDIVFPAVHGSPGEDGTLQGLLEIMQIPYVGCGVLSSALGMSKIHSKKIFLAEGINTPKFIVLKKSEFKKKKISEIEKNIQQTLGEKFVIKPASQGSAIGVSVIEGRRLNKIHMLSAFKYGEEILVEEYIEGREITAPILGNEEPEVLPLIEIVPKKKFYDYEAKYTPGMSEHIVNPALDKHLKTEIENLALRAYKALSCRVYARVDLILSEEGKPYVLEVNTLPGMTATSLYPESAKAKGIEFPDLLEKLINLSLEIWERRKI